MENMVAQVAKMCGVYLSDLTQYTRNKNSLCWHEAEMAGITEEDSAWLYERLCDIDNFKYYIDRISRWGDLKDFAYRLNRLGREMEVQAVGEDWEQYSVLEDVGFLITEISVTVLSLFDLFGVATLQEGDIDCDWTVATFVDYL